MKRFTVAAALCFAGGIVFASYGANIALLALAAVLTAGYACFIRKKGMLAVLLAFAAVLLGIARYNSADRSRAYLARRCDGAVKTLRLLVLEPPSDGTFAARADTPYGKLKLRVSIEKCPKLKPGEYAAARVTLASPMYSQGGSFDYAKYLAGQNIFITAYAETAEKLGITCKGAEGAAFAVRRYIGDVSKRFFSGDDRGLFEAMLIGSKADMSDKLTKAMRDAGLSHVAVVSGMHISVMLAALMYFVYGIFGRGRKGGFAAIIAAVFFAAVTGGGASIMRACIMCIVYQAANMLYRERDGYTALAVSVLAMSIYNPFVIMNIGFVFSALSVLGILMWQSRIASLLKFCPKPAAEAISLTLSAQLTVLPVSAFVFGEAALYSLVSNVLVSVFSSAVIILGMAFVLFSAVPFLSSLLALLCRIALSAVISVSYVIAALPGASIQLGRVNVISLCMYYAVMLLLFFFPERRRAVRRAAALSALTYTVVCTAVFSGAAATVTSMSYSLGGSTVVRFPENKIMLIDCENAYDAEKYLTETGKDSYECAVQTAENCDEMICLAAKGKIKKLIMPDRMYSGALTEKLEKAENKHGMQTKWLKADESESFGGAYICYPYITEEYEKDAVVRMDFGEKSLVYMRQLQPHDIALFYENGVRISADYILAPKVLGDSKRRLSEIAHGRFEESGKEFTIKR